MDNILIFTQNRKTALKLSRVIDKNLTDNSRQIIAFTDPVEFLSCAMEEPGVSGCFIDVDSRACDDLRLIKLIKKINDRICIVFMSESGRYAVEAFDLEITDYLKIPTEEEKVAEAVRKLENAGKRQESRSIYIRTFGTFEVIKGGTKLPWKNSKPKELFAFLVDSRGADVSSEKIQRTLWEDSDHVRAASTYHTTLYQLRKKLKDNGMSDILVGSRGSQRVNTELFRCDLYEFEKDVKTGTKDSYRKAFELYRGGYLENNAYKWSRFTKVRLQMQFEQLLQEI